MGVAPLAVSSLSPNAVIDENSGNTMLHEAINGECKIIFSYLLDIAQADPLILNKAGQTPFYLTTANEKSEYFKLILMKQQVNRSYLDTNSIFYKYLKREIDLFEGIGVEDAKLKPPRSALLNYSDKIIERLDMSPLERFIKGLSQNFLERKQQLSEYFYFFKQAQSQYDPFILFMKVNQTQYRVGLLGRSELHDTMRQFSNFYTSLVKYQEFHNTLDQAKEEFKRILDNQQRLTKKVDETAETVEQSRLTVEKLEKSIAKSEQEKKVSQEKIQTLEEKLSIQEAEANTFKVQLIEQRQETNSLKEKSKFFEGQSKFFEEQSRFFKEQSNTFEEKSKALEENMRKDKENNRKALEDYKAEQEQNTKNLKDELSYVFNLLHIPRRNPSSENSEPEYSEEKALSSSSQKFF
jgi:flagellar biosynthesis GTPase FlhF